MGSNATNPRIVHFGDCVLDLDTAELCRNGTKTSLQSQPFQILTALLENPGRLVTREELTKKLWPTGTFVDFDQSLNKAVARLREALGDNAEHPVYIETLSRRGYRWTLPLTEDKAPTNAATIQVPSRIQTWSVFKLRRAAWAVAIPGVLLIALIIGWALRKTPLPQVERWVQITNNGLPKGAVVTDGPRLYFEQAAVELPSLAQVSTEGGGVAPISLPFKDVELLDISANRSELLLGAGLTSSFSVGELWVLPIAAGPPHRLADVRGQNACWAPNGKDIAYANSTDLYLANVDGTQARKLATMTGIPFECRFSPDGARIRFSVGSFTTPAALWEIDTTGTGLQRLRENACCGSWSADGEYYFFVRDTDIWVTRGGHSNFDDRSVARLTSGPLLARSPVPSIDGKGLFVVGTQVRGELSRFDVTSKAVASFLNGISAGEVNISPDRNWAVYVSYPDLGLWRSKVDGTERLQLTFPPTQASEPQWSPDGKQIIFTDQSRSNIFVIGSEGGSIRQLMPNEKAEIIGSETWSPDGESIVFVRGDLKEAAIYRLNLQSGTISKVSGSERMYSARLSPTGRYISALRFSQDSLMLYDVNLGSWSELAHGGSFDCNSWSRDGRFVYVKNRLQGQPLIIERVRVADHKREQIAVLRDIAARGWVSLDSDGSVIFTRDASTSEIYRLDLIVPRF